MELLVVRALQTARERGDAMLSLSLSALAMVGDGDVPAATGNGNGDGGEAKPASSATVTAPERARELLAQHLARFYDFKGLLRWKRRFDPSFEDRYLVYPSPLALPRVALALIRAQSPAGLRSYLPWAPRTSQTSSASHPSDPAAPEPADETLAQ